MKQQISKTAINLAANARALEVLGQDQYNTNKMAVKSIKEDFKAAVNWTMSQHLHVTATDTGEILIAKEREQQVLRGYDAMHDDGEKAGQLAIAAGLYALDSTIVEPVTKNVTWPWPADSYPDKRGKLDRVRQLTIAGALIAAEIDREIRKATLAESEVASV